MYVQYIRIHMYLPNSSDLKRFPPGVVICERARVKSKQVTVQCSTHTPKTRPPSKPKVV